MVIVPNKHSQGYSS